MTDRRSQIINPSWLHPAGPAQAICADQLSVRSQTTNPPLGRVLHGDRGGKPNVCSPVTPPKRSAETAVASTGRALSP
jgi:hypothetical protein